MRESIGLTESSTNPFWTDFKAIKAATLIADYTAVGESKKAVEIGLLAANDPAVKASPFRLEVQVQLARAFSADKQWQKSLYRYDQVLPDLQSSRDRLFTQAQAERASVAKKLAQK